MNLKVVTEKYNTKETFCKHDNREHNCEKVYGTYIQMKYEHYIS